MRKLYFIFFASLILIIALIIFAFVVIEKEKHNTFFYVLEIDGKIAGHVKVDHYRTEDKILYKSTAFMPKSVGAKVTREKMVFDRDGFEMEKWQRESKDFGVLTQAMYLENDRKAFYFLSKVGSKFSTLSNVMHNNDIFIFDDESIVTYLPYVDAYNFNRGGAQSFDAVYGFFSLLPPSKGKVIFTSIRDDYLNLGGKKIKVECIVVKAKTLPEIYIWVSKSDGSIIRLSIEDKSLVIRRTLSLPKINLRSARRSGRSYVSSEILFPSGDIALSGTLSIPKKGRDFPAVLLVSADENYQYNRENAGLYTDISHDLTQNGYVVLRYDRRGLGNSQGDNMSSSLTDEINDIQSALKFLANHEKTDPSKVFIVTHSTPCSYVPTLDFSRYPVKGIVMLAPTKTSFLLDLDNEYYREKIQTLTSIDESYPKMLGSLKKETIDIVTESRKDSTVILGKLVYVKRMKELLDFNPLEALKAIKTPLLIIYGKKDRFTPLSYVENMEKILKEKLYGKYSVIFFRGLGHFLGEMIIEEDMQKRYKANEEVLEAIKGWIISQTEII